MDRFERILREALCACNALLSEWKLGAKDWPSVTEAVLSIINHAPSKRLRLRSGDVAGVYRTLPVVFTGHELVTPRIRILPLQKYRNMQIRDEIRARTLLGREDLQKALHSMHKDVSAVNSAPDKLQGERYYRRPNIQAAH